MLQEQQFPISPEAYASVAGEYLPHIETMGAAASHEMTRLVAERHYDGCHDFNFGLDLIIEGLERLLALP